LILCFFTVVLQHWQAILQRSNYLQKIKKSLRFSAVVAATNPHPGGNHLPLTSQAAKSQRFYIPLISALLAAIFTSIHNFSAISFEKNFIRTLR